MSKTIILLLWLSILNDGASEKNFNNLILSRTEYFKNKTSDLYSPIDSINKLDVTKQNKRIIGKPNIHIVSNYMHINSVKEFAHLFKIRPVYVDLWATWCEPCIEELKHDDNLYNFLKSKGVDLLYISIDNDIADTIWRNSITNLNLIGYHIRANQKLKDNLTTLIWGAKNAYSIPHYLLFNRSGELIDKNMPNPSSGDSLNRRISQSTRLF